MVVAKAAIQSLFFVRLYASRDGRDKPGHDDLTYGKLLVQFPRNP